MNHELRLEVYGKNFALAHEAQLQTSAVPRVGEYVALPAAVQAWVQNMTHALVHEVEWLLDGAALVPVVRCHATDHTTSSNRLLRLEEQGWLQPRN